MSQKSNEQSAWSVSHTTGLSIALVMSTVFWLPSVAGLVLPDDLVWRNVSAQLVDWGFALTLIGIVLFWEKSPISSLGFKQIDWSVVATGLGLGGFVMVAIVGWTIAESLLFSGKPTHNIGQSDGLPPHFFFWYAPFALITASFAEEIIYRGYAMERLLRLGVRPIIVVAVTQVAFALYHLKDGVSSVLFVATFGSLFALYYLWTRNLWVTIIGHFFVDSMAILGHVFNIRPGQ